MTKPLFSIVMPVLNAAPYLERALRSVLEQAGDDTEVIVVDGGSTDGSVEVIEAYCDHRPAALTRPGRSGRNDEGKSLGMADGRLTPGLGSGRNDEGKNKDGAGAEIASGMEGEGFFRKGAKAQSNRDVVGEGENAERRTLNAECRSGEWEKSSEARELSATANAANRAMGKPFRNLELQNSRTRFYWCSEPDGGQSAAMNKGFAQARGEFFFWVNGDDLLMPGMLDKARVFLRGHPACQWLAGNLVYIDEQDRVLHYAFDGKWHDWLYRHAPVRVYGPTSIFKSELFNRVGGFDESLHYMMDTDIWLRFKAAGARFERLPHVCWAFRMHGGSKTAADLRGAPDPLMLEERARVYAKNGLRVTRGGLWLQRLWRLLNWCYLRAWLDTRRMRGKKI